MVADVPSGRGVSGLPPAFSLVNSIRAESKAHCCAVFAHVCMRCASVNFTDGKMLARTQVHGATAPVAGAEPARPPDAASLLPPALPPCTCIAQPNITNPVDPSPPAQSFGDSARNNER